jgi:hypothetical protein
MTNLYKQLKSFKIMAEGVTNHLPDYLSNSKMTQISSPAEFVRLFPVGVFFDAKLNKPNVTQQQYLDVTKQLLKHQNPFTYGSGPWIEKSLYEQYEQVKSGQAPKVERGLNLCGDCGLIYPVSKDHEAYTSEDRPPNHGLLCEHCINPTKLPVINYAAEKV